MKLIKDLGAKLNNMQMAVVATVIPMTLFVITYYIAAEVDGFFKKPFDLKDTWYVWLIFLSMVGFFEYHLFANKK